jgi:glutathione synthase/RimK-type ligase-like ATP-grasp enzyme
MAKIGCFVERYNISRAAELTALTNFRMAAVEMGHSFDFLFRPDTLRIPEYDALFIRALTDPMNASYVASRIAEMSGLRVLDDPDSIIICCDKVNMYEHLRTRGVRFPETKYVSRERLDEKLAQDLFEDMGTPLILKAPYSSFSTYVEKVTNPEEFVSVARRYYRRSSLVVVQQYVPSSFDWRVTTLDGEVLFVCKYVMPANSWKLQLKENGHTQWARIEAVDMKDVDQELLEVGLQASAAIGRGLYGVDVKETRDGYVVIEVNDNPNIDAGGEDVKAPQVYRRVIEYLAGGR